MPAENCADNGLPTS